MKEDSFVELNDWSGSNERTVNRSKTLLDKDESTNWVAPSDLDAFFLQMFTYFSENGFWPSIIARILSLATLAFTICFSTYLMVFVKWSVLFNCSNTNSCDQFPLTLDEVLENPSFGTILVLVYFSLFSLYWLWNLVGFLYWMRSALSMRTFYSKLLKINDRDLPTMEWHTVIENVVKLQDTTRLCLVKDLSALDITNRIMRKDNYLIAFFNMGILDYEFPAACCKIDNKFQIIDIQEDERNGQMIDRNEEKESKGGEEDLHNRNTEKLGLLDDESGFYEDLIEMEKQAKIGTPKPIAVENSNNEELSNNWFSFWPSWGKFYGKALEWNLRFCLVNSMFDSNFEIRRDLTGIEGVETLKSRFFWMGILNLVLLPFTMIFMLIYYFLKYAEEFHRRKSVVGPREWTPISKWKLRDFNELDHFFQTRLNAGQKFAEKYLNQFPSPHSAIFARFLAYIAGAFIAVMLLLALLDSDSLTHLEFAERPLYWWLTIFSLFLATARSFIPDDRNIFIPNATMEKLSVYTHYFPKSWKGRCNSWNVYREFEELYTSKMYVLLQEIMCILTQPIILCFTLPKSAERIVKFIEASTVNVKGVGDICCFAELKSGERLKSSDTVNKMNFEESKLFGGRDGKLEKSIVNFAVNHPKWEMPPEEGEKLLKIVEENYDMYDSQAVVSDDVIADLIPIEKSDYFMKKNLSMSRSAFKSKHHQLRVSQIDRNDKHNLSISKIYPDLSMQQSSLSRLESSSFLFRSLNLEDFEDLVKESEEMDEKTK